MSTDFGVVRVVARALLRDWRSRPTRVLGAVGALLVCSVLFGLVFTLTGSIQNTLADGSGTNLRESALLIRSLDAAGLTAEELEVASAAEGVEQVSAATVVATRINGAGLDGNLMIVGSATPDAFFATGEAVSFANSDSLILTQPLADDLGLAVGDDLAVNTPSGVADWTVIDVRAHEMAFAMAEHHVLLDVWQKPTPADIAFLDTDDVARSKADLVRQLPVTTLVGETRDLATTEVSTLMFIRALLQIVTVLTAILAGVAIFTAWRITVLDQSTNIARLRLGGVATRQILIASGVLAASTCAVLSFGGSTLGAALGQQLDAFVAQLAGVSGLAARPASGPVVFPILLGTVAGLTVGLLGWFAGVRTVRDIPISRAVRPSSTVATGSPRKLLLPLGVLGVLVAVGLWSLSTTATTVAAIAGVLTIVAALLAGHTTPTVSGRILRKTLREPTRTLSSRSLLGDRGHITTVASLIVLSTLLFVAISGTISSLVAGLQTSVNAWTQADLYVEPALPGEYLRDEKFDADLQQQIADLPFVENTGVFRLSRFDDGERSVQIQAWSRETAPEFVELAVEDGLEGAALWEEVSSGASVAVSVNYAALNSVDVGDTITIPTVDGARDFQIAATVIDFLSDGGVVYTDAEIATEISGDDRLNAVFVTLRPGTDLNEADDVLTALSQQTHPDSFVMTRQEMRDYVIGIGRQLLSMLLLIAIAACAMAIVASIALVATALTSRERTFALQRLEGITARIQRRMLRKEFLLVGLVAAAWGCVLGVIAQHALGAAVETSMGIRPALAFGPSVLISGLVVGVAIPLISSFTSVRSATSGAGVAALLRDDR